MKQSLLWSQLKILIYRNFLLKTRNRSVTLQEIIFPIYFVVLLVILRITAYQPTSFPEISNTTNTITSLLNGNAPGLANDTVLYVAPDFPDARRIMDRILNMNKIAGLRIEWFNTSGEMEARYLVNAAFNPLGIYFPNSSLSNYYIRFPYTSVPSSSIIDSTQSSRCRSYGNPAEVCPAAQYLNSGFSFLQAIIDTAIIKDYVPDFDLPNITVQRMPISGVVVGALTFQIVTALYLILALSPFLVFLLVFVVYEKEKKIKEAMCMMGLNSLAFWLSWSITYSTQIFITTLVMSLIAVFGQLFPNSNFFLVFLLFFLYGISMEMLGFMLTPFFTKARTAASFGSFLSLVLSLLFLLVVFANIPTGAAWALSLLSPTSFAIAINQVSYLDVASGGATFANIWDGQYPVGIAFVMLPVDIVLYFLLTLYFDKVVPGEYGQARSIFFCLTPSYWLGKDKTENLKIENQAESLSMDEIEPISDELKGKESIKIKNLYKIYKKKGLFTKNEEPVVPAVNNFSLNIYEGQITAILGHNGAGKTTLFNILTGFVSSTSGNANVLGYNIRNPDHMNKIRQMTGVCPQNNILFDDLSVIEHLRVYAGIKNIVHSSVPDEIKRIVKLIDLEDQENTLSKKLSGGQKRKLCVGIAIMGDPQILILDEPTAGMDPYSRHKLWSVLKSRKEGKVTLLTTHFMDEADILADRKAIISCGKLRCVGSSLFLKNRYGVGYHLGVVVKERDQHEKITECISRHVEGSELQRSAGFELGYTLPILQVDKFAGLFSELEARGNEMNVQSFGVSMTTLEEVFLKIGEEDEGDKSPGNEAADIDPLLNDNEIRKRMTSISSHISQQDNGAFDEIPVSMPSNSTFDPNLCEVGKPSTFEVYKAMVRKQIFVYIRNPGIILFGLLFPIGLAIGSGAVLQLFSASNAATPLPEVVPLFASAIPAYGDFMYRNSTGSSLLNFTNNVFGVNTTANNFENMLLQPVRNYIAADIFQFDNNLLRYNALYNTTAIQSLPAIINLMSKSLMSFVNQTNVMLDTYNFRWPSLVNINNFDGATFGGTLMGAMAVVISSSLAAVNPVKEREKKIRSQVRVSGITFNMYWISSFTVDYCWLLFIALAFIIGLVAFQASPYIVPGAIVALIFLILGWGAACVLTSYCISFMFDKFNTVSGAAPNIVQFAAVLPYVVVSLLDQLSTSQQTAAILNVVFSIFIPYYVGFGGIYYISKVYIEFVRMGLQNNIPNSAYFDWSYPMVPFSILISFIQVVVFSILLKIADVRKNGGNAMDVFRLTKKSSRGTVGDSSVMLNAESYEEMDSDVKEEQIKVNKIVNKEIENDQAVVLVNNLTKAFVKRTKQKMCQKKKKEDVTKVAVDNVSLSVYPGEVLGLLGPNGAGKTTMISTLTADNAPTKGKVFVSGYNIQSNLSQAFQEMGYCPQDNPLWENLTLYEHLEIYAAARGVKKSNMKSTIISFIDAIGVREHMHKRAKHLSGGTMRKLCFIIAMLGNPHVVLMDEPSTGMDPKTKRFMWNTISSAFAGTNRGAILTTHYMDEADALCSRVGIMVLGRLRCLGSTQHLKSKFGQGYILEIKLKKSLESKLPELTEFVNMLFPNASEPENFSQRFVYKVPQNSVTSLSTVFSELEQAKDRIGIEEYSFSQSTLEQVFLQFAREQDEEHAASPSE